MFDHAYDFVPGCVLATLAGALFLLMRSRRYWVWRCDRLRKRAQEEGFGDAMERDLTLLLGGREIVTNWPFSPYQMLFEIVREVFWKHERRKQSKDVIRDVFPDLANH